MKNLAAFFSIAAIVISCNTPNHLHHTGTYTIKERTGDLTEFYEVKGVYNVIADTLKKNDKIVINVIRARPYKKRGKMKTETANLYKETGSLQ